MNWMIDMKSFVVVSFFVVGVLMFQMVVVIMMSIVWQGFDIVGMKLSIIDMMVSSSVLVMNNYVISVLNYINLDIMQSFVVYCIEFNQCNGCVGLKLIYNVEIFIGVEVQYLQGLFFIVYVGLNSYNDKVVFQLVLWELVCEIGFMMNVIDGSFSVVSSDVVSVQVLIMVNFFLVQVLVYSGLVYYSLIKLMNVQVQDFIMVMLIVVVFEFEIYVLFLGGLGVIGLLVCCCLLC